MSTEQTNGGEQHLPMATHKGTLRLDDLVFECCVLEDGRRVFNKKGMGKALGLQSTGGNAFLHSMARPGIKSEIPESLSQQIASPILFKTSLHTTAHGYEATVLVDVCKTIIRAHERNKVPKSQEGLVRHAQVLLEAFAKVGVTALVDEATGFQEIRDPNALQLLVQQYVDHQRREWEKQFPNEFYDILNKLYGNPLQTKNSPGAVMQHRPQYFGAFTRQYVYFPLANGAVLDELDRLNPRTGLKGNRAARFHQHLKQGFGLDQLKRQMLEVLTLMRISDNQHQFKRLFERRFPGVNTQMPLFGEFG